MGKSPAPLRCKPTKMCVGGDHHVPHKRHLGYGRWIYRVATHKYIIGNMPG
jgi:hypothetical protein